MQTVSATFLAAFVLAGAVFVPIKVAKAQSADERQARCVLAAIRDTRSAVAVQFIRSACSWLALNADSLLNAQIKPYYLCLVQNLTGAQADAAAQAVVTACRTAYPPS
jgi:hypothetical protein